MNINLKNWLSAVVPKQLRIQILVVVAMLFLITFSLFTFHVAGNEADRSTANLRKLALELSKIIAATSAHLLLNNNYHALESILLESARFPDLSALQVIDINGKVIADVIQNDGQDPTPRYGQPNVHLPAGNVSAVELHDNVIVSWQAILPNNPIGWVKVSYSTQNIMLRKKEIWRDTIIDLAISMAVAFFLLYLFLKKPMRTIRLATDFAENLNRNRGNTIVVSKRPIEIFKLATALNQASEDLYEQELSIKEIMQDLQIQKFAIDKHAIVSIANLAGTITYVNDKFCETSQYSRGELVGQNHNIVKSEYHPKDFFHSMWETINSGNVWQGDICNKKKDRSVFWVRTTIVPYLGENGQPFQYVAIRTDITQQVEYEHNLRCLAAFPEHSPGIVISINREHKITYTNPTAMKIMTELANAKRSIYDLLPPQINQIVNDCISQNSGYTDIEHVCNQQTWLWSFQPIHNENIVHCYAMDISDRKRSENALKETRARLKHMLGSSSTIIYSAAPTENFRLNYISDNASQILGFSNSDMVNNTHFWLSHIHPDDKPTMLESLPLLNEEGLQIHEYRFKHKDGDYVWMNDTIKLICDKQGAPIEIVGSLTDISHLKNVENKLIEKNQDLRNLKSSLEEKVLTRTRDLMIANKELQKMNQMKSEFISLVSHELRTPLTSIKSFAEILMDDLDELDRDIQYRYLSIIDSESDRLGRLINDVLDLQKIDAGKMTWNDANVDVITSALECLELFAGAYQENNIQLIPDIIDEHLYALFDPDKLKQVLTNLLSNALKFTNVGSVTLKIRKEKTNTTSTKELLVLSICDTGIGIPSDQLAKVFERFHQVDNFETRKLSGSGLGLSICKQFVEYYQGTVIVTSVLEKGSTFTISIPALQAELKNDGAIQYYPSSQTGLR